MGACHELHAETNYQLASAAYWSVCTPGFIYIGNKTAYRPEMKQNESHKQLPRNSASHHKNDSHNE